MKLSNEQLIECYNIVFDIVHSDSFKVSEMEDLLSGFDHEVIGGYIFAENPRANWQENLTMHLDTLNYFQTTN